MVPAALSEQWTSWASLHPTQAIVIGGSAGALETLRMILPALAETTAIPVVVVLHLRPHEPTRLPALLASDCALPLRLPLDKQPCTGGVVWLAPPDFHLLVEDERVFSLAADEPVHFSRPAIDVLFASAADAYGPGLVAVVLAGASRDGAAGAAHVRACGGFLIVEDPATAEYPVMPAAAIAGAAPHVVTSREGIAALLALISAGARAC